MYTQIYESTLLLEKYIRAQEYKGYDPYDGLNSVVIQKTFLKHRRLVRLLLQQSLKRLPINLRPLLGVKKEYNPKGLALFISGYCDLYTVTKDYDYFEKAKYLVQKLIEKKTSGYSGSCWGYNFDWQARAFFQPRFTPTVVVTTFVGYALLDYYDLTGDIKFLDEARSACDFVLKDLNRTYNGYSFCWSYSPLDNSAVYNASLLGCKLLSRVYSYTKESMLISEANKAVQYVVDKQNPDGSWVYSDLPFHAWIDNFHTGFNLECISEYIKYSGDTSFRVNLDTGLDYYLNHFFDQKGRSKYFNNTLYPIDCHAPAQLVLTLQSIGALADKLDLINRVLNWTIQNMQASNGNFYYQQYKYFTNRISYIRWTQAWMFYGLTRYMRAYNEFQ